MPFFSRVFGGKDAKAKKNAAPLTNGKANGKPQWTDAWVRTRVDPEEVAELIRECTLELKSRALDIPFLLLPFRPSSDPSAARTFVRNYFLPQTDREALRGSVLVNEVKMTEVMVLASVIKWCWSRLPGGVVTWEAYEMFKVGERDAHYARDAFTTFLPISVESDARIQIITDFFDLLSAIAAHGKTNGLGGRKLSRYAGWWAFEHYDTGKGFESGYKSWAGAADATSHLFFAYLRSLSPDPAHGGANGILGLPRSLQHLVEATEYPPEDSLLSNETTKVVMIVDVVSPTPYALLRRAKNFEYRDDDHALQQFASYDDPIQVLTDECRRVLKSISSINQSNISTSKESTSLLDPSWSRFEDIGFSGSIEEEDEEGVMGRQRISTTKSMSVSPRTQQEQFGNRPTTPSWADFLSSGFVEENGEKTRGPMLLPPDRMLPPIQTMPRGQSSQSHRRNLDVNQKLEPGELASINKVLIDDAFWWVWISSLAGEEPTSRKAVFGRCALIETVLADGKWMVMEEQIKGAAPEPSTGAYIAEKKSFLGFTTKRGRLTRRRSGIKKGPMSTSPYGNGTSDPASRATLGPDQTARIQQAAAELSRRKQEQESLVSGARRGRMDEETQAKTTSVFTLQPQIKHEASPAMQWASQYDKDAIRAQYLGDNYAGKGSGDLLSLPTNEFGKSNGSVSSLSTSGRDYSVPAPPPKEAAARTPSPLPPANSSSPPTQVIEPAELGALPSAPLEQQPVHEAVEVALSAPSPVPEELSRSADSSKSKNSKTAAPANVTIPPRTSSSDASHESKKLRKSRGTQPPGPPPVQKSQGIRRLFGTKRSKSKEQAIIESEKPVLEPQRAVVEPQKSPVETNPAILAARRALEGKSNAKVETNSPPLSPNHFSKMRTAKSPIAAVQTVPMPASKRQAPTLQAKKSSTPEPVQAKPGEQENHGVPRTRKDDEYDNLSRVDTNEREHADREFSTFDQGPLLEQPAFAPLEDSPPRPEYSTPSEELSRTRAHHQSTYSQVTMQTTTTDDDMGPPELTRQISPTDRWAQIRKNAAERAAKQLEEGGRRSHNETRTDDGETSGEETIESRVARIKARVAELTGNMEHARR